MKKIKIIGLGIVIAASTIAVYGQKKNSQHNKAHQELIANQSRKNGIKLLKESSFVDFNDEKATPKNMEISMEYWKSRSVNPYKESEVPEQMVINVTGYVMPVPGEVTSGYGFRPRFGRMHKGVDMRLKTNDTVRAAFDGKIRIVNYEAKGYGNYVVIRHPNGLETVYGHLNKHLVKENQTVKAGQAIGLGGSTGRSTGPHLHFETRFMGYPINPAAIFDFANHCTHTDQYTFSKKTYTQARNFAPTKK